MHIVIGCEARNSYISQLKQGLSRNNKIESVDNSLYRFWRCVKEVDILHLQWPEELCGWKDPAPWELARLDQVLSEWSKKTKIVATIHNYKPHRIKNYELLYQIVYKRSDAFIHLGEASRDWFSRKYDFASDKHHAIIPHGNYACFPNQISRSRARKKLNLNSDDYVCLCFGEVRYHEERNLLVQAFDMLSVRRKKLVFAGRLPPLSRKTLRYWRLTLDPRLHIHQDWIADEDVQLYLNAADVVIIPRQGALNSGNVALGFTFGRVVIGPDEGVIGEVLSETGNPVYEPGSPQALADALERARDSNESLGERNKAYAMEEMNWAKIAKKHLCMYHRIRGNR